MTRKRQVVLFQPFSGIWNHAIQDISLLLGLSPENYEVITVTCGALFPEHCTVRESRNRKLGSFANKSKIDCIDCRFAGNLTKVAIGAKFEGRSYELGKLISGAMRSSIDAVLADSFRKPITEVMEETIGGIPVGKFAMYETLLKFKKLSLDFSVVERDYFNAQMQNVLLVQAAAIKFFETSNVSDLVVYSPQYAINNAFAHVAQEKGVRVVFAEGSSNIYERDSHVRLWDWGKYGLLNPAVQKWPGVDEFRASDQEIDRVRRHFSQIALGASHSVYSPSDREGLDIRVTLGIPVEKKIAVLALSSYDEVFAAIVIGAFPEYKFKSSVFDDQFDWVTATIDWARSRDDIFLVVRLHPRDLPNHREDQRSEQINKWESLLQSLPPNVVIDHPSKRIPISAYWNHSSVWITGWSSTALEALHQGIEVVTYDSNLPSFPSDIHRTGTNRKTYFMNLEEALESPLPQERLASKVEEWLAFNFSRGTVSVGNTIFSALKLRLPRSLRRLVNAVEYVFFPVTRPMDLMVIFFRKKSQPSLLTYFENNSSSLY